MKYGTTDNILIRKYNNLKNSNESKNTEVLFTGDSLFESFDLNNFDKDLKYVNTAIGGITTRDLLTNIELQITRYNFKKVFILIGTNDIQKMIPIEETKENIKNIFNNVIHKGVEVYVLSLLPINSEFSETIGIRTNEKINNINDIYKSLNNNNFRFLNIHNQFLKDGELNKNYTYDGIHLSKQGYEILYKSIKDFIK